MSDKAKKLNIVPKPSREELKKIRASLGLRAKDPLPRCPARNARKTKLLGPEHSEAHHLCAECRCSHIAGFGTNHYGVGYCIYHENAKKYKAYASEVAHRQKVALQQGYPDQVYKYQSEKLRFEEIRTAAEEAHGRHQLREEVVILRSTMQKFLQQLDQKENLTLNDIDALGKLAVNIAKLAKVELEVTDSDYVHVDQVKAWLYEILRAVQEEVEDVQNQKMLLKRLATIPNPNTGRF